MLLLQTPRNIEFYHTKKYFSRILILPFLLIVFVYVIVWINDYLYMCL